MDLDGKVAIVTGGSKGIGRAIAEALVRERINVCISARKRSEIDQTVVALKGLELGQITGIVCDVCDHSQVKALIERTVVEFGGLDILVNNAGIGIFSTVEETSPKDFRSVIETNLFGVYYCCYEAIPLMKQRGGGYIINMSRTTIGLDRKPTRVRIHESRGPARYACQHHRRGRDYWQDWERSRCTVRCCPG